MSAAAAKAVAGKPRPKYLNLLLGLEDNDLWDIVSGRSDRYAAKFGGIVARLRAV